MLVSLNNINLTLDITINHDSNVNIDIDLDFDTYVDSILTNSGVDAGMRTPE